MCFTCWAVSQNLFKSQTEETATKLSEPKNNSFKHEKGVLAIHIPNTPNDIGIPCDSNTNR